MIKAIGLSKSYKSGTERIKAVNNIQLTVDSGEFVSIIGHSGSGKTTLLSLIGGLTKPDSGSIRIHETELWSLSDDKLSELRNNEMSFIYQFASLLPTLTVIENILLPTVFNRKKGEDIYEYAKKLLEMFDITEKERAYPSQLSGGQQRRVAIARAFINRPKLILADEPTGDLDEETEDEVMKWFHRIHEEERNTFIIVTHSSHLARQTDKQYKMVNGTLQGSI